MLCSATDSLSLRDSKEPLISPFNYVVLPKDGHNGKACDQTAAFIKQILQQPTIWSYTDYTGKLLCWGLNATDSQADSIRKIEGVKEISLDEVAVVDNFAVLPLFQSGSAQ